MRKFLSIALVFALAFTIAAPVAGTSDDPVVADPGHYTMEDVIKLFSANIDGDNQVLTTAMVYKGWRTSNGNWLKGVMYDLAGRLEALGYTWGERTTANNRGDSIWYQINANSTAWNPQYVAVKIVDPPTSPDPEPRFKVELDYYEEPEEAGTFSQAALDAAYTGITDFRKAYPSFANLPLTDDLRDFCVDTIEFTADCIDPTSMYYPAYVTPEYMFNSLSDPGSVAYKKMQEVNSRCHMPTNMTFYAYTDETKTVAENIAAGTKTGQVVYVGTVTATSNSLGIPASELAGKIIFSSTSASTARTYANNVGAIAALGTQSSAAGYRMPVINGERWYTDYVPYTGAGNWAAPAANQCVALHWSLDKFDALMKLLEEGDVYMDITALGTYQASVPREMLVAEIQGATKPHERVYIPAHINEPGCHDNASGVAIGFEIASKLKKMIDDGIIARPARTITFVWGDEITMTNNWEAKYRDEFLYVKGSIDLDMSGGDPVKIGGNMLIEKTPDPSNVATTAVDANLRYRYGQFTFPGQTNLPNFTTFIREPDKFSLWTSVGGSVTQPTNNYPGLFLNDLYMQTGYAVQELHKTKYPAAPIFEVEFNPYEGGSDHSPFVTGALGRVGTFIPALLTWHFTDYVYHSSHDTLDKVSAQEMLNVGTVSAAVAYQMANADELETVDTIDLIMKSWEDRIGWEMDNAFKHKAWMDANPGNSQAASSYFRELKAIGDWSRWYIEAVKSAGKFFIGGRLGAPYELSSALQAHEDAAVLAIQAKTVEALDYVDFVFGRNSADRPVQIASGYLAEPVFIKAGGNAASMLAQLPSKITIEYVGGGTGEADVTWSTTTSPTYAAAREGLYRVTGTLSGLDAGVLNWAQVLAVAEVNTYTVPTVYASIGAKAESHYQNTVEYTLALKDAVNVLAVDFEFMVDGTMLSSNSFETLNGFSAFEPIKWTDNGDGTWTGAVRIGCPAGDDNGFTAAPYTDIAKFVFDSTGKLGEATLTITKLQITGLDPNGENAYGAVDFFNVVIEAGIGTTVLLNKYDLNKDGTVDLIDLGILLMYVGYNEDDPDWDTLVKTKDKFGNDITPKDCDVNGDGEVDMADIVELLANFGV